MNTASLIASKPALGVVVAKCAARQREVDNALIVQALCERQPTLSALAQLKRYVAGELSREQAFAELYVGMV